MIDFWEPNTFFSSTKFNHWVITDVQSNWYIIGTKSINNQINCLRSITNFFKQTINEFLRKCMWLPTKVTSWVRIIKIIFVNWSMNWCWFWAEIISSACVFVMYNIFGPYCWYNWSWWTICRSHNFNTTYLNLCIILWLGSPKRGHEFIRIIIYTFSE